MKANLRQQEAIEHFQGPLLIIAGAGSGKTATLTQRIAYLINHHGVTPSNILALTFTNKAAGEMKERTGKAIGQEYHPHMMRNRHLPYMGTFHSFGIFILKEVLSGNLPHLTSPYQGEGENEASSLLLKERIERGIGLKKNFLIYDETDKLSVMKDIIKNELGLIEKEYPPRQVAFFISDAKNKGISAKDYNTQVDSSLKEVVAKVFERYEQRLSENNALDFDDILLKLLRVLEIPEVLQAYQERYTFIMVDEYQDTNMTQYQIVKLLVSKYRNLGVVGDDWQSIYSWRGADMRNIINFKKDYPEAKIVKLEQNYRSTKTIIAAANTVIKNNTEAMKKELWTDNVQGEKIHYNICPDDNSESNTIAENIGEYVKEDGKYSDNLILYRTNAQSRSIEEALLKKAIPYKVIGGMKFYDRKEIKDILAYLRVIHNGADPVSLKRIINTPSRKIGAKSIEILDALRADYGIGYFEVLENIMEVEELRLGAKTAMHEFYTIMKDLGVKSESLGVSQLIGEVIASIGYEEYLRSQFSQDEYESKKENLLELKNVASEYDGLSPRESLSLFLEEVALISDLDSKDESLDSVTLMTIHTSKGLEEKRVFIAGLEDGMFPHSRTHSNPKELEEERRLMYVAMTRARDVLFISRAKERLYFGDYVRNPESRFMREIPTEYIEENEVGGGFSFDSPFSQASSGISTMKVVRKPIEENNVADFKPGMRVSHHKFGVGIIDSLIGELAEIRFRDGVKKMNIRIAPVKIAQE